MIDFVAALVELWLPETHGDGVQHGESHEGQSTAEYVILVTIIVALAAVIALFRNQVATMIQNIIGELTAVS